MRIDKDLVAASATPLVLGILANVGARARWAPGSGCTAYRGDHVGHSEGTYMRRRHSRRLDSRDYDAVASHLAASVVVVDHTRGRTAIGKHAYIDRFRRVLEAYPDMQGEAVSVLAESDQVVQETRWQGRHNVPMRLPNGTSLPPTNEDVTMHLVTFLELDDGGNANELRTYGNPRETPQRVQTVGVG